MPATRPLTASQRDWLRIRSYLSEHRYGLAVDAAGGLPGRPQGRRDSAAGCPRMAARRARPAAGGRTGAHLGGGSARPTTGRRPSPPARDRARRRPPSTTPRRRCCRAAGRDPLPSLLGRAAGPGRPGGVREPRHLPADRGSGSFPGSRPGSVPAGVHLVAAISTASTPARRPRLIRGHAARRYARPACAPLIADPGDLGRRPVNLAISTPDAAVGPGHRARVVPAALAGSGQGGPRGRAVPGDPGGRVPAVRRSRVERTPGFLAVAVP